MNFQANQLFTLEGKTAVLTGASGFLGRTFARALLANGARVVALGRSERLESEAAQWAAEFGSERVRAFRVDMRDRDALERTFEQIVTGEDFVEILVNNAHELGRSTGFNTPEGSLDKATPEQLMGNLAGGLLWPVLAVQRFGAAMKARRRGSIINIATMYALVAPSPRLYAGTPSLNPPGYSAAKAAMMAFTRYTASFWGEYGIRCNAILPGPFSNTEDAGENSVREGDFFLDRLRQRTCLGRIGRPRELAGALLFLASEASSYVTGHGLVVDGGWTVV